MKCYLPFGEQNNSIKKVDTNCKDGVPLVILLKDLKTLEHHHLKSQHAFSDNFRSFDPNFDLNAKALSLSKDYQPYYLDNTPNSPGII